MFNLNESGDIELQSESFCTTVPGDYVETCFNESKTMVIENFTKSTLITNACLGKRSTDQVLVDVEKVIADTISEKSLNEDIASFTKSLVRVSGNQLLILFYFEDYNNNTRPLLKKEITL